MHRNYCLEGEEVLHAEQSFHMQHNYEFFGFCVLFRLQKISVLSLHNLAVMTKSCSASTFNVGYRVLVRPCLFFFFSSNYSIFQNTYVMFKRQFELCCLSIFDIFMSKKICKNMCNVI